MKFTQKVKFYKVNEDGTVTFYIENEEKKMFYRAKARFTTLIELAKLKTDDDITATLGLAYIKGQLVLQLIEYQI